MLHPKSRTRKLHSFLYVHKSHVCTLFLQNLRDMVYARRIKIAQLGPEDEVEGVIEGPFEWIYFEMPIVEVGGNAPGATDLPCLHLHTVRAV